VDQLKQQMLKDMTARSPMEVVFDILEIADGGRFGGNYSEDTNGVIQTEIVNKTLLDNNQLKEYLRVLTENDLLSFDSATRKLKITQKGRRFLEIYNNMSELVKEEQEQQI